MKINLKKIIIVFFLARLCFHANLHSLPPFFFAPTSLANQAINSPQEVLEADIKNLFSTKIDPIAQELKKMRGSKETDEELTKKKKKREQELRESQQRRAMQERSRPRSYSVPPYGFPRSYSRPYGGGGSSGWRSPYSSPTSWGSSASNWNRPSSYYPSSSYSSSQPFGESSKSPSGALGSSDTSSSIPSSTEDKKSGLGDYKSVDQKHRRAINNKRDTMLEKLKRLNADLNDKANTTAAQNLITELPNIAQTIKEVRRELDKLSATTRESFEQSLKTSKASTYKTLLGHCINNLELVQPAHSDDFKTVVGDIKETLGQADFQSVVDNALTQAYQKRFVTRNFSTNQPLLENAKKYLATAKTLIPESAAKADPLLSDIDRNLARLPATTTPSAPTPAVITPAPAGP
ncbi:hypothetical protein K2X40_05330 [Candidatus Babeliales bacterium]|nr:hypothetical protein [Candidatus Babeliales bacterium]